MLILEPICYQLKIPMSSVVYLSLSCWSELSQRPPKQYTLLPLLLISHQNLMIRPYDEDTHGHKTWRNQVDADQEEPSLLANFHSTGRYYAGFWRMRESHQQSYPVVILPTAMKMTGI